MKLSLDPKGEGIPPWHFIKPGRATLAGHMERVSIPAYSRKFDWEAELAVIIGSRARDVSVENALACVAGYSCANDLSARDAFARHAVDLSSPFHFDWIGHKCFPGACPVGPFLTPAQFVGSPEALGIRLWVNDRLRQDGNTRNHLYGVAEQIAYLSSRIELQPGDVLLTGTPAGVGMETGTFLARGDVVRVEIDHLGTLVTPLA
jgi:2-keto-4-pentenoate hydratase/2-oxohepta-3-ene-1,7-dioic acid hydratase in catechol pathway